MQKRVLFIAFLLLAICNKIVADDQLTASDVSMYPGDSKEVSVVLTNEETYVGFQFDLYLPDGLTVESFSGNSNRLPDGTTPQMAQQSDGSYRFIAAALGGNPIAGNDGPVLTLTLKSAESIAVNDYTGYLRNVKISKADGSGTVIAEQTFTVTVNATVWSVIGTINGNWDTDSEMTSTDGVNYTVTIPYMGAGSYEFKIRANGDWTENYGLNGAPDGQNIPVTVPEDNTGVVITFNKDTKEISYSLVLPVYTVSGDFNGWSDSEAMTKDANGIYFVTIDGIDAGGHEFKIRTNNSWDVNYGLNGLRDGDNIPFTVAGNSSVTFYFDPSTKIASTVYPLAPEPYAVVTEVTATENTVTLYYDNLRNSHERTTDIGDFMGDWANLSSTVTTVTFDPSFAAYRPTSTAWWFSGFSNMTAINGIENLCTDEVTDMNSMFMSCTSLPSIDLSHFNTGQVVDMSSLFNECTSLTELDLSSFNTANVSNMEWMFYQCSSLKTIYVGEYWSIANVSSSQEMFNGCTVLTGGNGTTFNENNVTAAYAHLDGGTANPGYFTPKNGYGQAAIPTFTHEGNLVFINSATEGATIRYTIDGEAPTDTTGIVYSDSIRVTRNCTVRAIAIRENFTPSEVAEYEVNWFKVANVEFAQNGHTITLTTKTDSATIHYTLLNSGAGEQIYTAPLTLNADCTIEAYATRSGYLNSDTTSFVFHADGVTCSNPVFAQNGNVITITTQTENAQIYYTIDGTEPTAQSLLYADSIVVDHNMVIKAIAMRENYYPSQVTIFVVDSFKCKRPEVTWDGDQLTATTTTEGAIIEYSLTQPGVETPLDHGGEASPLKMTVTQDAIISLYAVKTGWTNSDTLVIDYPYTAWQELLAAVTDANAAIQQAAGNDNVPQQMLNELQTLIDDALATYSERTAERAVVQEKTAQVRDLTEAILEKANAIDDPYAVLTGDTISGMTLTFYYDKKKIDRNGMNVGPFIDHAARGWYENVANITRVVFDASFANDTTLTSTSLWFYGMSNLTAIDGLQYLKTQNVTSMYSMFYGCSGLTSLDLSTFNTQNVTDMVSMFNGCYALTSLDVTGFNTQNVMYMNYIFGNCSSLTSLDVSGFNTKNVTDMGDMFYGCSSLTSLDLSGFNTQNVTGMSGMFRGCSGLKSLNLSSFNTQNVTYITQMFYGCSSLTSLDLSNFNTQNVTYMDNMFSGCSSLTSLNLSSFDTQNVMGMVRMFYGCSGLTTICAGSEWSTTKVNNSTDMFAGCTSLVGGMGTVYDDSHVDHAYARIDGGTSAPGYLTDINSGVAIYVQANEIPYLYAFDADGNALNGEFPGKLMTDTATVNGQLFYKTRIYRSVPFNINIIDKDLYRTREIYIISDRYFVYEGQSKYTDVTTQYFNAPEIQISSLALPGSHNNWDRTQQFEVVEAGKKYSMQIDLGDMTFEDNQLQFKLYANDCAWLGITSLTLDAPSYVHSIGNPELIASDRNIVINLANAPTREFKFEATWNGGTQMEEGWTLKISEVEVQPEYTFDNGTGVLTISGGTTMADALDAAGGRDEVAKTITAIVWNSSVPLTNSDLQGLDNPNMLVYVQSASQAPANRDNVVIGTDSMGYTAKNIKLTDVTEGNGDFYCPIAFTAEMITYTHNYSQQTEVGVSRGWETIALPFTVQTITHKDQGLITPFAADTINKHFWLRQLTELGLAQATVIEANTPYLISMPNSDAYTAEFNLNGRVTFSSQNVEVPQTQTNVVETHDVNNNMVMFVPCFQSQAAEAQVYALNVGEQYNSYAEGSVFVANYRNIRPFEAFTVHHGNGPAPQFITVSDMNGGLTGIEEVRCKMADGRSGVWYDLNGRRLQQKPTKGGVYILNGKKVVLR